jgi:hypothetical protein
MGPVPGLIGDAMVICSTAIDQRHRPTGQHRHTFSGELQDPIAGLAICQYAREIVFHLFECDANWNVVTASCHGTLEAARKQAEAEYEGVCRTWQAEDCDFDRADER